ncbi:MAG: alpha/beta hydrolase [Thermodesulfobacteriota bacterium]
MNLSFLDHPLILRFIFYPRRDFKQCPDNGFDLFIMVEPKVYISSRFYLGDPQWPWILYFHGNGEVVSDYNEWAPFYHQIHVNLVVADYRGYGASDGVPMMRYLLEDAHKIFGSVKKEISERGFRGDLWVMGRSLGSLSALELASSFSEKIKGLIIESGAISLIRVFRHLGLQLFGEAFEEIDQEWNEKVKRIFLPSLIIHGAQDTLISVEEGIELYHSLGSKEKRLLIIPQANHNDLLFVGFKEYFGTIKDFIQRTEEIQLKES